MITDRVWTEMHKAKGYLLQIELYTDKKRRFNRNATVLIVIASVVCALTAPFPDCKWTTIVSAVIAAVSAIMKECLPHFMQSEEELKKMDKIHDFYKDYLRKLEILFIERFDSKTDVDDIVMITRFDEILKTEKKNESDLNRLCRVITKREEAKIQESTRKYLETNYHKILQQ